MMVLPRGAGVTAGRAFGGKNKSISLKPAYERPAKGDGLRLLVDRL